MNEIQLRPYQQEALDSIPESGAYVICLATGLGKTVCMSQIPRRGRMLILSHRDELVHQPEKYFDCSFGVEQANETSHGEEIVSASVQSLVRRLNKFDPHDFDVLVTDECFPASVKVNGVPISEIKVGNYVTAYNHELRRLESRQVLRVIKRPAPAKFIKVGNYFMCTHNHPIYDAVLKKYVKAEELSETLLLSCFGCGALLHSGPIKEIENTSEEYVYNLDIEGLNNYFANGILVHNCHHSTAASYRKIYDYFKPRLHLGFTATPNRNDGVGLSAIYQDIIFERNLRWGVENNYLSPIKCLRVEIGFDLHRVATRLGDFANDQLDKAINIEGANKAVAEVYRKFAKPPCLIFCASVAHAEALAKEIPGAVAVRGGEDRSEIVKAFSNGEIPCLTNCMVFTEGTDLPNVKTIIMARPTKNISLYCQCIGRGTRLAPGKDHALIIDCVGAGDDMDICTAPSLVGLDIKEVPPSKRNKLQGNLFTLPEIALECMDTPESWIQNAHYVELWAKEQSYNLHNVNFFRMPDGSMSILDIYIPPEDSFGRVLWKGNYTNIQKVIDEVFETLKRDYSDKRSFWDLDFVRMWGEGPATEKQIAIIRNIAPLFNYKGLTKFEASQILARNFKPEPPTPKQIYFLRRHGYDTNKLTKRDASVLIGKIKASA